MSERFLVELIVRLRFDKLNCPGSQIGAADTDNNKRLGILYYPEAAAFTAANSVLS